ncbi:hypothetical protein C0Z18_06130 [Trinickia dabaoshanensis]|uniref:IrrE N-terminal-like domain-containing protein n=1 Tax=Trinickia dabaoshanensis TaxID=564714 RepID=A0A2N7VY55_9BURK|nr:hypothetical protein [Trinickia dabaoshanensis]PMS22092.1 hypothetical protein C0Z18_06130 [Trinickia dabaoshanensis]
MSERWSIGIEWAQLDTGAPEERAGFAALGIHSHDACLTFGYDSLLQSVRRAPYLSAYHLAEWLAWNWWRLRWEPHRQSADWELSHAMASIGGGYIWPNIHIVSDGINVSLISKPTSERIRTPYRYLSDSVSVISATDFEGEVDLFVEAVLQRLQSVHVTHTNLHDIWRGLAEERQDPALTKQRKFEALLGEDPGEMDDAQLQGFIANAEATGQAALEEIAANRIPGKAVPDIPHLLELGHARGVVTNPSDRITLHGHIPHDMDAPWRAGTRAAQLLRAQENIDPGVAITNDQLARMYGATRHIFDPLDQSPDLSFDLSESDKCHRVILRRAGRETARRFALARLLGDALTHTTNDAVRPATHSDTYRQKVQRAFAAELLSPFQAVDHMLDGDYSAENQQEVADHFQVSDRTILTLLVNQRRLDRGKLDEADWVQA